MSITTSNNQTHSKALLFNGTTYNLEVGCLDLRPLLTKHYTPTPINTPIQDKTNSLCKNHFEIRPLLTKHHSFSADTDHLTANHTNGRYNHLCKNPFDTWPLLTAPNTPIRNSSTDHTLLYLEKHTNILQNGIRKMMPDLEKHTNIQNSPSANHERVHEQPVKIQSYGNPLDLPRPKNQPPLSRENGPKRPG